VKKILVLLISLLAVSAALAGWEPPRPRKVALKNGLTLLLLENRQLPVVSLEVMVRAGSITDPGGRAGLSNFTAEMLARGTRTRSALEIAESFDLVGAQFSVRCEYDAVFLSLTVLARDFAKTAPVLFDLVANPAFDPAEVSRMQGELAASLQARNDRPNVQSSDLLSRMLYSEHPYAHPPVGWPEDLARMAPGDLSAHHRDYYVPNNCVISLVGDFRSAEAQKLIQQGLGKWARRETPPLKLPAVPAIDQPRARLVSRQINQAYINLGFLGPRRDDPDYQAIRVMNYILGGGGFVSRLVRTIRMAQGLAYDVDSYYDPRADHGPYLLSLQTKCASADTAVKSLLAEMRRIQSQPVSDEELKEAKEYLRGSYPFRFETNGQMARQFLYLELYDLGPDYFRQDIERTMAVTQEDVLRAARKFLRPDNYLLAVVTDTSQTRFNLPALLIDQQ
jgi:zinc protease